MKWPSSLTLVRHDVSQYNVLREVKAQDSLHQEFVRQFELDPSSQRTRELALQVQERFALRVRDASTPLLDPTAERAYKVGRGLARRQHPKPDVVHVSPYIRTQVTWGSLWQGFTSVVTDALPPLVVVEERVREQDHGLATLYNDWRVFHALHPEQRQLYNLEGSYRYRYPQGENVPDVRERNRSWLSTVTRDFRELHVWAITHHLNILATRANLERLSEAQFLHLDEEHKPVNCGVTRYVGEPNLGRDGKLVLQEYNERYWE